MRLIPFFCLALTNTSQSHLILPLSNLPFLETTSTLTATCSLTLLYVYSLSCGLHHVLIPTQDRQDAVKFTIATTSAFRLYLPVSGLLDVDVTLYKDAQAISTQNTYGHEEIIQMQLSPGNYSLKVR